MSLTEIESKVLQLSEGERRRFARWFYEHELELVGTMEEESDIVEEEDEELKAELLSRKKEMEEHPENMVTFDVKSFDRMARDFADERAQRTSARSR